jgi:glycosyltransferase involved in cell wall biosynthesis
MLSIVIPVKNEQETLSLIHEKVVSVLNKKNISSYEIIFIDDGSTDDSWTIMERLANKHPEYVKAIKFRKNFGKSYALMAGFTEAKGKIIITMDADLQDDPEEIPNFLQKIDEGYDLVSGWKKKRNDPLSKTIPSKIFNKVTGYLSGLKLHDFNCGFKAYKKEVLDHIQIYGDLHRYIPVLAHDLGYKVAEIPVKHHPRKHGITKYGMERYVRGFLDLLTILTTTRFLQRPGHFFGGLGILSGILGAACLSYLVVLWSMGIRPIGTRPLFFFGILAVILCFQLISLGLLAEISVRSKNPRPVANCIEKMAGKPFSTEEPS